MKIFICLLFFMASFFLTKFINLSSRSKIMLPHKKTTCIDQNKSSFDKTNIDHGHINSGNPKSSGCLPIIVNRGMFHFESDAQSKSRVYGFFSAALSDYYNAPNEFNVVTNDSKQGASAQKYDPREDLHIRFKKEIVYDQKAKYGVLEGIISPEKLLSSTKCLPTFVRINQEDSKDIAFTELLKGRDIQNTSSLRYGRFEGANFTFFSILNTITFGVEDFFKRYRLFRNNCNKGVSILLNFCVANPSYDLQYEDMFVIKDHDKVGSNVYCRKSNEKNWTLIKSHIFNLD